MYICLYNLYRIHFYHTYAYATLNDGSTIYLNEVESFLINEILLENNYNNLIQNLKLKLEVNSIQEIEELIEKLLISLKIIIKKIDNLNTFTNTLIVTGKYNMFYPEIIQISLTNYCMHKCIHCYKDDIKEVIFLNTEDVNNLLSYIKGKVSTIQFTGGEPLFHKGLKEIVKKFKKDFIFSITTSAFINLTDEIISILKEFDIVQVSLYGSTSNEHDNFTNTEGSFKIVTKNIKKMVSEGIDIDISTIITPLNISKIEEFIKLCISMNVKSIMFGKIIFVGRAVDLENSLIIGKDESFIREKLNIYKSKYLKQVDILTWEESNQDNIFYDWIFKCGAGRFKLAINDDGTIVPCYLVNSSIFSMGELKNNDYIKLFTDFNYVNKFNDLWKNKLSLNKSKIESICEKIELRELK